MWHHVLFLIELYITDCGIRPATSAEAEWLQDYIQKSNNSAGQQSINAARSANGQSPGNGQDRSDEDEDDDSEGGSSAHGSKRSSLVLSDSKGNYLVEDLADKTPTAATLLSQAQATQRPSGSNFHHAPIRRHISGHEAGLGMHSHSPPSGSTGAPVYLAAQQPISVRHLPQFPSIEEAVGASSTSPHGIAAREVWGWFLDHLDSLLESIRSFRFDQFEMNLRNFWSNLSGNHREVVHAPAIAGLMARADAIVYDVSIASSARRYRD